MIEKKWYIRREKYHLEFIMEDGDFDIYDVVNENIFIIENQKEE